MIKNPESPKRRQPSPMLVTLFCVMVAVVSIYSVLPYNEPWTWLLLGVLVLLTGAFVVSLAHVVLRQREDYWREHSRHRRNPEFPGTNDTSS